MFEIGEIVKYKNTSDKYLFKIKGINNDLYILYGINNRKIILSKECDIYVINKNEQNQILEDETRQIKKIIKNIKTRKTNKYLFGRVLHIDGDEELLNKCLDLYKELGVSAEGICIKEEELYLYIEDIIRRITPDIIVLTGHDKFEGENIKDLSNYKNTSNFIKAIRIIRKCYLDVIIIAGACESHFEALIGNGANIASSPKRINTHTYDPAIAAIKVATTPYDVRVDFRYIYKYIENGKDALGGIETNGKMRLLL